MFCIPFYKQVETSSNGNQIQKIVVFLAKGGAACLEGISPNEIPSFCKENGFVMKKQFQTKSGLYLEIDSKKTDISSFYNFEEAHKTMNECWRTFIWVSSEQKDSWNVNTLFQSTPFYSILSEIAAV